MKAMSLRISMQTLSPGLTPSLCSPLAMRSARSATSAWLRRRSPLMMPRKRGERLSLFFRSCRSDRHGEERVFARARTGDPRLAVHPSRRGMMAAPQDEAELTHPQTAARASPCWRARLRSGWALPISFMLLDGFGQQRRAGIDGQIVEHALGGADRVRALAGDLARDLEAPRRADRRRSASQGRSSALPAPRRCARCRSARARYRRARGWPGSACPPCRAPGPI